MSFAAVMIGTKDCREKKTGKIVATNMTKNKGVARTITKINIYTHQRRITQTRSFF